MVSDFAIDFPFWQSRKKSGVEKCRCSYELWHRGVGVHVGVCLYARDVLARKGEVPGSRVHSSMPVCRIALAALSVDLSIGLRHTAQGLGSGTIGVGHLCQGARWAAY